MPGRQLIDLLAAPRMQRRHVAHLLVTATVPIVAVDHHLRFSVWNWSMEEMSGVPADAVLGQRIVDCVPCLATNGVLARTVGALHGQYSVSRHVIRYPQSTALVLVVTTRRPIYSPSGRIEGALSVTQHYRRLPSALPCSFAEPHAH